MNKNEQNQIRNKSLAKAIEVLNCFIDKQPLGVTEISEYLGLYKSNVHDILRTYTALGYLEQDSESGKYRLGVNAVKLGRAANDGNAFKRVASAHLQEIAESTGETCYLTIPNGFNVFYLDIASPNKNNISSLASSSLANNSYDTMNSTASGKSMLAHMKEDIVNDYISKGMPRFTEYTITDPETMREELELIRKRGYATDEMENSIGIRCVAVPILSSSGSLMGAMSISGPSLRISKDKTEYFASILMSHAKQISEFF